MESNKDEALHCIEIAEKLIQRNNSQGARKFLKKSLTLFPSDRAQNLLLSIQDKPNTVWTPPKEQLRKKSLETDSSAKTPIELDRMINHILTTDDYYDILHVANDASDWDIKRSYKKLALLLHPDKTKHPAAAEAFKAIRNAVSILTDQTKRRKYDVYGPCSSCSFRTKFSDDVRNSDRGGNNPYQNNNKSKETYAGLYDKTTKHETFVLKLIWPLIFVVMLTFVSTFLLHDPSYSLHKSIKYPVLRYSHNLKIPYYVKESFLMENSGLAITQLDNDVEVETITNLQYACYNERSYRNYLLELARERKNSKHISDMKQMRLPSCEILYGIQRNLYM